MSPDDFETLGVLGRGAFAEVTLARKRDSGLVYAIKKMRKSDLVSRGHVERAWTEWLVQSEADDNEWLVKLHFCFQTEEHVYLVMDYVPGGDLMGLLMRFDVFPEAQARFYAAEGVQAIASLHDLGYAHRDIKPDNFLLDARGHLNLADLGLAKCVESHLKQRGGGGGGGGGAAPTSPTSRGDATQAGAGAAGAGGAVGGTPASAPSSSAGAGAGTGAGAFAVAAAAGPTTPGGSRSADGGSSAGPRPGVGVGGGGGGRG